MVGRKLASIDIQCFLNLSAAEREQKIKVQLTLFVFLNSVTLILLLLEVESVQCVDREGRKIQRLIPWNKKPFRSCQDRDKLAFFLRIQTLSNPSCTNAISVVLT